MGGVLSCMSGNRHRDLSPGCGPCSGLAWLQPFQFAVWKPLKKQQHRQSPMDKRAFAEVQISSGEVRAQC